jgi:hypothetical protein
MYLEITLPATQRVLHNVTPIRMSGAIHGFPPSGDVFLSEGPVALVDQNGAPSGTLLYAAESATSPVAGGAPPAAGLEAFCTLGGLYLNLGGGPVMVDSLSGFAHLDRQDAAPGLDGYLVAPRNMTRLEVHRDSSPLGPVTVILDPEPQPANGILRQLQPGPFFPARGAFDLRLRITTPQGTFHNQQPFQIQATLDELWEPEPDPYVGFVSGVPLYDASGNPRGTLYAVRLQPQVFYAPVCAVVPACGGSMTDVAAPVPMPAGGAIVTRLLAPVPNPSNSSVRIAFDLASAGSARLRVYDVAGRMVRTLVDDRLDRGGGHEMAWDGMDGGGKRVPAGIYFVRLETDGECLTRKITLVR